MKKLLVAVLLLSLWSCSTAPITKETGFEVPADRIYNNKYVAVNTSQESHAFFTVFRDGGWVGSACAHHFFINNEKIFSIRGKEYIDLELPPGDYFFRIDTGDSLCTNVSLSLDARLKAGEHREYRISISAAGQIGFSRMK